MNFETKTATIAGHYSCDELQQKEWRPSLSSSSLSYSPASTHPQPLFATNEYRAKRTRTYVPRKTRTDETSIPNARRLSETDVRAIFNFLYNGTPTHLSFQIVPVGPTGLKLSPPSFEFQDGLYVLLRPPQKSKKQSKAETRRAGHQPLLQSPVPSHLAPLVWRSIPADTCPWSLSGPQLDKFGIQQRYCYPKGHTEYSSQKGAALWTMNGPDGKEDLEYRLLHVYFSAKRAITTGVVATPAMMAAPVSPTPSIRTPSLSGEDCIGIESVSTSTWSSSSSWRSTTPPPKRFKRSSWKETSSSGSQPSSFKEAEVACQHPASTTSSPFPARRPRPPPLTLSHANGDHSESKRSNTGVSECLKFSPISSSSLSFFPTPTRNEKVKDNSQSSVVCKCCGNKQRNKAFFDESEADKLSLETAAIPCRQLNGWESPFSHPADDLEESGRLSTSSLSATFRPPSPVVASLKAPTDRSAATTTKIFIASGCAQTALELQIDKERTGTLQPPLDSEFFGDLDSFCDDSVLELLLDGDDDENGESAVMQGSVGEILDIDSISDMDDFSIDSVRTGDWVNSFDVEMPHTIEINE